MLIPLKTANEKKLIESAFKASDNGASYADLVETRKASGLASRSFGGVFAALQKKGWTHRLPGGHVYEDFELTCDAIKELGGKVKRNGFCNGKLCSCNDPKPEKHKSVEP